MDDIVMQAMRRWPHVPNAYGWLSLDRRGRWRIKGECIGNPVLSAFIDRNYGRDEQGRWFFQNGPQRVFVRLECAPFVLRHDGGGWRTHTGLAVSRVEGAYCADDAVLLATEHGLGSIGDRDLPSALDCLVDADGVPLPEDVLAHWLEDGTGVVWFAAPACRLVVERTTLEALARRHGFVPDPRPAPGEPEC